MKHPKPSSCISIQEGFLVKDLSRQETQDYRALGELLANGNLELDEINAFIKDKKIDLDMATFIDALLWNDKSKNMQDPELLKLLDYFKESRYSCKTYLQVLEHSKLIQEWILLNKNCKIHKEDYDDAWEAEGDFHSEVSIGGKNKARYFAVQELNRTLQRGNLSFEEIDAFITENQINFKDGTFINSNTTSKDSELIKLLDYFKDSMFTSTIYFKALFHSKSIQEWVLENLYHRNAYSEQS